jgi:hypothetical protein
VLLNGWSLRPVVATSMDSADGIRQLRKHACQSVAIARLLFRHPIARLRAQSWRQTRVTLKSPSTEISAIFVSILFTIVFSEWWHWIAVLAAILVIRFLSRT